MSDETHDCFIRVFNSSTFRDVHPKRDQLVPVAFSELRENIERLGLEFFDVDLCRGATHRGRLRSRQLLDLF